MNNRQGERKNATGEIRKGRGTSSRVRGGRGARHLFDCRPQVVRSLHSAPGFALFLEDKGLVLAVHYRGAPPRSVRLARPIVLDVAKTLGPHIHIVRGDKVWEILPHQIDGKGSAIRALLSQEPPSTLPIIVGDDQTDERAFAVLPRGLTVRVGKNLRTRARYLLRDPEEVNVFLQKLEVEIV